MIASLGVGAHDGEELFERGLVYPVLRYSRTVGAAGRPDQAKVLRRNPKPYGVVGCTLKAPSNRQIVDT